MTGHSFPTKRALLSHLIDWHMLSLIHSSAAFSLRYLRELHRRHH